MVSAPRGVSATGGCLLPGCVCSHGGCLLQEGSAPGGVCSWGDIPACTPPEAELGIRSMSGRYASYWNAFLFFLKKEIYRNLFFSFVSVKHTSHGIS